MKGQVIGVWALDAVLQLLLLQAMAIFLPVDVNQDISGVTITEYALAWDGMDTMVISPVFPTVIRNPILPPRMPTASVSK